MKQRVQEGEGERFVTPGGKDLKAWLAEKGLSIPAFCEMHNLDRVEVQRVISGERIRISVDMGVDLSRATGGAIPVERFGHPKAVRAKLLERWRRRHGRAA